MPDFYGPLALPAPANPTGGTFSDPAIDTILSFLQAVINRNGNTAWQSVNGFQSTGPNLVNSIFGFDPTETDGTTFNTRDLPALFMWRSEVHGADWLAADYYVRRSKLVLLWVPPPATQANRAVWQPAVNLISSIVDGITDPDGRDPAWVQAGDTDPIAAYQGSLLWKYLPNMWEWNVEKSERTHFDVVIDGDKSRYQCVKTVILFRERNVVENPEFNLNGIDITISQSTSDSGTIPGPDDYTLSLGLSLTGLAPNTGQISGGTPVTILGVGFDSGAQVRFGSLPPVFPNIIYEASDQTDGFGKIIGDLTTLIVLSPPSTSTGTVDVTVSNSNGESASLIGAFTFYAPFTPASLSGLSLWARPGSGITLNKSKVTRWADQSGNGNDLTALVASAPTFIISDSNMSNGSSLLMSGAQKMNTAAMTIAQPNTIIIVARVTTLSGNPGIIDDSVSRQIGYLAGGTQYAMDAGATLSGGTTDTSKHTLVYVFNGASSRLYVDTASSAVLSGNAGSGSGSGGLIIGTQSTGFMTGEIQEVIVYNRALSTAEINQILSYTGGTRPSWTPPKSLTFNGNSIMFGDLASPVTLGFAYLSAANFAGTNVFHDAFEGYTTQQCDAQAADPSGSDTQYSSLRPNNVDVMLEGLNDYHNNGSTPAQVIAHLATYVTNRRAAGCNKVVMCTLLPSVFMTESDRALINAGIRGGSTGADAVADIGNTSTLMGTYSTTTNPTYYADQTHPTAIGHALIAPVLTAAINTVW